MTNYRDLSATLRRRVLLGGVAACAVSQTSRAEPADLAAQWLSFKSRFLSHDGRIVDNGNGGISHSEGQGWGLLFAAAARDQVSFDLILKWTSKALRRPNDTLHAWRYVPHGTPPVQDLNNAVDGDMFIATALIKAGRLWGRPDYLQAAAAIGRDILRLLLRQAGPYKVLLPGTQGFETTNTIIINPSYYAFPMMTEIDSILPSPEWARVQEDGIKILELGRFGRWSLPPDWLQVGRSDAALSLAPGWPPRFSYDAVRVPLWWTWQKLPAAPVIQAVGHFWSATPAATAPAWADLRTNDVAPYPVTPGMLAVIRLMQIAANNTSEIPTPNVELAKTYYDAALIMLTHIAEQDLKPR